MSPNNKDTWECMLDILRGLPDEGWISRINLAVAVEKELSSAKSYVIQKMMKWLPEIDEVETRYTRPVRDFGVCIPDFYKENKPCLNGQTYYRMRKES